MRRRMALASMLLSIVAGLMRPSALAMEPGLDQQKLVAPDPGPGDDFGSSIAIDGNTLVIGDPADNDAGADDRGAAYVFARGGDGVWTFQQQLLASDGAADDAFGVSVAISGDTIVVGAFRHDAGAVDAGAAYVFARSGGVWTQQQKLVGSPANTDDLFGVAVAVDADTIVVGAAIGGPTNHGSAFVFVRSGGSWVQQQELLASDPGGGLGDLFGEAVAISGETIVIGALGDDGAAGADQGAAYVFERAGGTWTEQQKLIASNPGAVDTFGSAVAISGDTLVVGAPLRDRPGGFDQGSAFVFVRTGGAWTEQQELLTADPVTHDEAGYAVAISGERIVVSVDLDDGPAGMDQGSAAVFVRSGESWTETLRLVPDDAAPSDQFGISVTIDGDTIAGGAIQGTGPPGPGAAYVFTDGPPVLALNAPLSLWPPNHKYHVITVSQMVASATDDFDGDLTGAVVIDHVTSDEPDDAPGGGDGHTIDDIVIAADYKSVQLRAERRGGGDGRVYAITLRVVDSAGHVTVAVFTVGVPPNQGG